MSLPPPTGPTSDGSDRTPSRPHASSGRADDEDAPSEAPSTSSAANGESRTAGAGEPADAPHDESTPKPGDQSDGKADNETDDRPDDDQPDDDSPATLGELREPQRLHPLTLLQRILASSPALLLLMLPVLMNPDSQNVFGLVMTISLGVVALPAILLQYYRFSYRITEKQIIIQSGVFNRKNRSIPIERVQNVQIEQNLLARIGTIAKVSIETAGSSATEGVLEYVSLSEAHHIRQVIRSFQRASSDATAPDATTRQADPQTAKTKSTAEGTATAGTGIEGTVSEGTVSEGTASAHASPNAEEAEEMLFAMPLQRVLLSGMFRFSLVYIAVVFSVFQFVEPDTLLNYVLASRSQLQTFVDAVYASPFFAAVVTISFAVLFGWLTGIAINLSKYYGFRLWLDGDKLRKRHGLFTLREGTIPLDKVQALILHTNPLMEAFGWYAMEAQTVGLNVDEQGHRVVVPFAKLDQVLKVGQRVRAFELPDTFHRVSLLTIRRSFVRYLVALSFAVAPAVYFWPAEWWHPMDVALPYWAYALSPLLLLWAYLQYTHHGYNVRDDALYIRRGVIGRYVWILPTEKQHVFYTTASVFQRRLGLKSFFVDTAGAAGYAYPEVVDVPADIADNALDRLYDQFHTLYQNRIRAATGSADTRLSADERPQLPEEATEHSEG